MLFNILGKINIHSFVRCIRHMFIKSATPWITFPKVRWLLPPKCYELETQKTNNKWSFKKITHNPKSIQSGANKKGASLFYVIFFCTDKLHCALSFASTAGIHKVPVVPSVIGVDTYSTSCNKISVMSKKALAPHSWEPSL